MKTNLILGLLVITALVLAGCGTDSNASGVGTDYSSGGTGVQDDDGLPQDSIQGQLPAGSQGQPPNGGQGESGKQRPDLAAAAEILGITEEELRTALENNSTSPGQGPPDFEAAAAELGISLEELMDALGGPADGGAPAGGTQNGGNPGSGTTP